MKRMALANLFRRSPAKAFFLTYLCLFLLPWQTVWVYGSVSPFSSVGEGLVAGEYWKLTVYAVQFLIVVALFVRGRPKISPASQKILKAAWLSFAALFLSCLLSVNLYLSSAFLFHLFFALLLFWLLLDERISTERCVWFFAAGLVAPCLLGWWQVLTGWSPPSTIFGLAEHLVATPGASVVEVASERLLRAYGSFPHPNIFGGYLVVAVMTMIVRTGHGLSVHGLSVRGLFIRGLSARLITIIKTIVIAITAATLVITFSRSAWLALAVGIISFFAVSAIWREKIPRRFIAGLVIVLISFVFSIAFFHNAVFARIVPIGRLEAKSLIERQGEYQTIWEMAKINPFTGIGPGAYTWALAEKYPDQPIWSYQPMHNSFLLFFAETGLLGLVVFGYMLLVAARRMGEGDAISCASITLPIILLALLDHYLWSQWTGLVLMAVVLAIFTRNLAKN